ncbi:glycoside hydrolase family 27 protein [Acidicapsa dinghuensis]|uniref:Alpha-galactosidase n=1 Tax=Acidicapsa dinghuensis TaxID=2218256 RepID=A0ABW1EPA6_9BACT|nr:glycoside hydrolase family 27 protein [Acidicapsa dinghuensis]
MAPTPPLGWNSWDSYGLTIDEAQFKANVEVLASLKEYGWQYAVIDEGWYMQDPFGGDVAKEKFVYDSNGRLIPALNRFPDAANGAGLKPLADWVHAKGFKFGIHLIRGIPRESVNANMPIAGSSFAAGEAADTTDVCPWNQDNYGIRDNAAGQAWYDSMIALYAGWGIDFLKVDCIADHPYKISEIQQIARAIQKTGRPIVLSLSPGPTQLSHAEEVGQYAQMWRISDDHWDVWSHEAKPGQSEFPLGLRQAFDRLAEWERYAKPGNWPDEDMLPLGYLGPHPGLGDARQSRFTEDEARSEFTLWAIGRSPLILGANLTKLDDFTRSLITNRDVIEMNQTVTQASESRSHGPDVRIWTATTGGEHTKIYVAVFNISDHPTELTLNWPISPNPRAHILDLWSHQPVSSRKAAQIKLAPHACRLFRMD